MVLRLPEILTQAQAGAFVIAQLPELRVEPGDAIQVDAAALRQFDSSALAVLLELRRETLALGKQFVVHALPGQLADLAGLYGISELLQA